MPIHHLSNVDLTNRTAECSVCGLTEIYLLGKNRVCANRHRAYLRKYNARKREEYRLTHPMRPRGRKPGPPKPPRTPKPRVYGTQAHVLSEVDDENKTAVCSICGPVKIYISRHPDGNYVTRRCSKANSQDVMTAARNRRDANRVFIDTYKVEHGCARCGYNASPIGLDFHHRNPAEKDFNITKVAKYSRERLMQEIEKCDVLCAICHRLVHDELGYVYG